MTDSVTFFKIIVSQTNQFITAWENMRLIGDRIGADTALSAQLAQAATAGGRTDLNTASFDNLLAAINSVWKHLNSNDPNVNAATVKLPFYEIV